MNSLFFSEKFKDIDLSAERKSVKADLKGLYKISNKGNVKRASTGTLIKPYKNNNGYLCVSLKGRSYQDYTVPVHCLVADAFLENPDRDFYTSINHKDENKANADVRNLEWCTSKYNNHYSMHKRCKLSEGEIFTIWQNCVLRDFPSFNSGCTILSDKDICNKYSISMATLNKIKKCDGYYGYVIFVQHTKLSKDLGIKEYLIDGENEIEIIPDINNKMWRSGCICDTEYLDEKVPYMEK